MTEQEVSELEAIEKEFFTGEAWIPTIQQRLHKLIQHAKAQNDADSKFYGGKE